ncbi:MAG: response regulator transcription factor [Polyangiaceae bacterium]
MPKTLLAVDDSATMRKVLDITFAGDEFRVVAAENAAGALALMREEPAAIVIDTALGTDDGYVLAKAVRTRDARVAIVLMASRYNPYDAGRGKEAGADDFIDKPFDTQGLVDKVKKAILARESARSVAPSPPAQVAPAAPPAHVAPPPAFVRSPAPPVVAPSPPSPSVKPVWPAQRTHTLSFEGGIPAAPPPAAAPARAPSPALPLVTRAPSPPQHHPAPPAPEPVQHAAHTAATAPPRGPDVAIPAAANGQLAHKLGELGLNPQQVEAVLALSREVVERVVWEVVPQLAETIIKEEITRLTKEG